MALTRTIAGFGAALTILGGFGLASPLARARTLSLEERVAAQKAIEQVYWSHRIWPKENPRPKPPLAEVMPDEAIRAKVEDYLRKSNALEHWWQRPVTGGQLQAELNRMAVNTHDARTLTELYRALGNDPFVIAETLARQTLADRLLRDWYSTDARFHGGAKSRAEAALSSCVDLDCMKTMDGGTYRETTWTLRSENVDATQLQNGASVALQDDEWVDKLEGLARQFGTDQDALPVGRSSGLRETADGFVATSVLSRTQREMVTATVTWPKRSFDAWWAAERGDVGAAVVPADWDFTIPTLSATTCSDDTWSPTRFEAPDARNSHSAVWTGTEMIVWGGTQFDGEASDPNSTGARYNPATDTWSPTANGANVPTPRSRATAVWTGTEMIVWGGFASSALNTGGRYDPSTDTWRRTSTNAPNPTARYDHTAVWTGSEMIVWGGYSGSSMLNTGGRYNPNTDGWVATSTGVNVPVPRRNHVSVWTGSRLVVWGGYAGPFNGPFTSYNSGGRYDPVADSWTPTSTAANVPVARSSATAVWTGTEMIIWGGSLQPGGASNSGARYDPNADAWTPTSAGANVPAARVAHTAVWTGAEMIVWGGRDANPVHETWLSSGGRYNPFADTWRATSTSAGAPSERSLHTAVWSGTEMIVFGGRSSLVMQLDSGGRYDPISDSWVATRTNSTTPAGDHGHSATWTGSEMIVWPGLFSVGGKRYDPATDSWTLTSSPSTFIGPCPAVWTGTEMIVWTGDDSGSSSAGGRYNPMTNSWRMTSGVNAPQPRQGHTAVWSGTEMIVWGGLNLPCECDVNTGGRYDPSTDTWRPTSTVSPNPTGREAHTAVWTGTEMIVWGGFDLGQYVNTGGRYNPTTDSWTATSTGANVPSPRSNHTAVWTGSSMIVWGGAGSAYLNTGGRYDPTTNSWALTSTGAGVPSARTHHTAVWAGSEMVVWGGSNGSTSFNTGGRYDPVTSLWTSTSIEPSVPSGRLDHTAVWTGNLMIVWGGKPLTATGARYCVCPGELIVYRDADADGYGNAAISLQTCDGSVPAGYVANAGDCNDTNASVHPGTPEDCNGVDDNCDGFVDNDATVPPEIGGVSVNGHGPTTLSWIGPGGGATYDLATSTLEDLRVNATTTATCLADDVPVASYVDPQPDPIENSGYYYLVRASNGCGAGNYGFDSAGAERIPSAACP